MNIAAGLSLRFGVLEEAYTNKNSNIFARVFERPYIDITNENITCIEIDTHEYLPTYSYTHPDIYTYQCLCGYAVGQRSVDVALGGQLLDPVGADPKEPEEGRLDVGAEAAEVGGGDGGAALRRWSLVREPLADGRPAR